MCVFTIATAEVYPQERIQTGSPVVQTHFKDQVIKQCGATPYE